MSKCANCGADLPENTAFCPNCGTKVEAAEAPKMGGFCGGCGTQLTEGATFCPKCGKPVGGAKAPKAQGAKNNMPGIIAIAAVVLILLIIICSAAGGGYKKPIKNYMKGVNKANSEKLYSAFPEEVIDGMVDDYCDLLDMTEKEFYEYIDDSLEDAIDGKISYKIGDKEKLSKSDLKDYEDYLERRYDEYFDEIDVTKGYSVDVTVKSDGEKSTTTIEVYKVNGDWTMDLSMFSLY